MRIGESEGLKKVENRRKKKKKRVVEWGESGAGHAPVKDESVFRLHGSTLVTRSAYCFRVSPAQLGPDQYYPKPPPASVFTNPIPCNRDTYKPLRKTGTNTTRKIFFFFSSTDTKTGRRESVAHPVDFSFHDRKTTTLLYRSRSSPRLSNRRLDFQKNSHSPLASIPFFFLRHLFDIFFFFSSGKGAEWGCVHPEAAAMNTDRGNIQVVNQSCILFREYINWTSIARGQ